MHHVIDPARAVSHVEVRVRFGETDLMGIVHHANYLGYFEAARVAWLRRRGAVYATWAARGWHLPVVETAVRYRAPARFDDVLMVTVELAEIRSHSMRFAYRVTRRKEAAPAEPERKPRILADGFTRLACVDSSHELLRLPHGLVEVLLRAESREAGDAVC
jgi:acyl-CoA thioester hydrolase